VIVYIGLGTNLGDRFQNLARAKELLISRGVIIEAESPVDETDPVDFYDQPKFLNQVIRISTNHSPLDLLDLLLGIETMMGRIRNISKGPRIIDLDILLYGNLILNEDRLTIPHSAICKRDFVLRHLISLDPDLCDPLSGKTFSEVYREGKLH
jgi:2-amino-4-hydroxy-6-hydroxymethyldihydropteridine diphosphokinase